MRLRWVNSISTFFRCCREVPQASVLAISRGMSPIHELVIVHDCALAREHLAARAEVDIALVIVGKIVARERAVLTVGFAERRI
jgi:hypothetical protein